MADDNLLAERLLRVIDEGRRTATYKLALLLALIDRVGASPGIDEISTREIAAEVLNRYYPQTRLFVAAGGMDRELKQISMKGSPVLRAALRIRLLGDASRCRSADDVRKRHPDDYATALSDVEDTFVRYPIPLLQVVGSSTIPFLYEPDWPEGTSAAALRRQGRDTVRLLPGVADRLVVLGPLLRPLIELHWTQDVARWSGILIDEQRLREHLFGADRASLPAALREGLADLQDNSCFYCGDRLGARREVDHFLAWSRWPNDSIENLVLADRCNGAKSDHIAVADHVHRWAKRTSDHQSDLAELADQTRWPSDPERTRGLVVSTYNHIAPGTPLWRSGREFETATGPISIGL